MSGLSKHLALSLFNMSLNPVRASYTPPLGLWLGLHTSAPSDSTYGNEATFGAYARQTLNSLTAQPLTETVGGDVDIRVTNGAAVVFPASTGPGGQTITHWSIWDSATPGDGNILYSGVLGSSRLIVTGDSVVIPEGSIQITIK
jgi:hypothetical protein